MPTTTFSGKTSAGVLGEPGTSALRSAGGSPALTLETATGTSRQTAGFPAAFDAADKGRLSEETTFALATAQRELVEAFRQVGYASSGDGATAVKLGLPGRIVPRPVFFVLPIPGIRDLGNAGKDVAGTQGGTPFQPLTGLLNFFSTPLVFGFALATFFLLRKR